MAQDKQKSYFDKKKKNPWSLSWGIECFYRLPHGRILFGLE